MTTPGNNGASTPEEDDPFGYLYADGQAAGATPPGGGTGGYGYPGPRSSYNQVRTVGERQYGQHGQQQHGQQAQARIPHQNAHYAAPETLPGGSQGDTTRQQSMTADGGRGRGRGPNTKGLLIGAIAVVAAVVVGIGVAILGNGGNAQAGGTDTAGGDSGASAGQSQGSGEENADQGQNQGSGDKKVELPKEDAKALTLAGGTSTSSDIPGSRSGTYVQGLNTPGASATWTVSDIPKDGKYTLYVAYGVPGKAATTTLTVNGKPEQRKLNMDNFANAAEGDWEKGWTNTYAQINLTKGTNTLKISCETGDQCEANLDQVWLVNGWPKN
ncbi:carbohydrate-binding protein [Streptomyces sp. NPDC002851]